jgi:hypothetical protein
VPAKREEPRRAQAQSLTPNVTGCADNERQKKGWLIGLGDSTQHALEKLQGFMKQLRSEVLAAPGLHDKLATQVKWGDLE